MKPLAVNGYDAEEVRAALHAPSRSLSFTYECLLNTNAHKSWITGSVLDCEVANNSLADINRTARFLIKGDADVNWLSDRIRPWFRLRMPDGGYAEWPLGIFLPSTPLKNIDTVVTRPTEAYDQNLILLDDKVTDRYRVAAATNVVTAIITVLNSAGINQVNYTASAETLPVDREWEPGTSKRLIVNDLLRMINYRSIWFSSAGFAEVHPYVRPDQRVSEYTYAANAESVLVPMLSQEFDLFNVANKWTAVVSEADRAVLTSTYTNASADSPTSTVNRGRTILDFRKGVEATSQAALDALVQRLAFEASQVYEVINFETALMPHHEDADLLTLDHPDVGDAANYVEHTWSMKLKAGEKMRHSIRRVVTV